MVEDSAVLKVTEGTASDLRGAAIEELRPGTRAADDPRGPAPMVPLDAVSRASLTRGLLSPLLLPAGHESHDGTARVGQNGHLFLTGGSNNLSALYADDTDYGPVADRTGKARQWLDVFARRAAGCEARGITYLQTLIPEKSTALRHLAPTPITAPTPLLGRLHESLLEESFYLDGLELWEKWDDLGDDPYFEPDTHFSPAGAKRFFLGLVEALGAGGQSEVAEVELDAIRVRRGDLSDRFGLPIYARSWEPSREATEALGREVETVYRKPSASRAVGSRYAFRNSAAPIDRKVLVFGNSFFQNGRLRAPPLVVGEALLRRLHLHLGAGRRLGAGGRAGARRGRGPDDRAIPAEGGDDLTTATSPAEGAAR